jgi:stress-induced morphogen
MIAIEALRAKISLAFPGAEIELTDLTGTQDHYEAAITSAAFEGKSRIEQHKMVYGALAEHMGGAIHALALKTRTPSEASLQVLQAPQVRRP